MFPSLKPAAASPRERKSLQGSALPTVGACPHLAATKKKNNQHNTTQNVISRTKAQSRAWCKISSCHSWELASRQMTHWLIYYPALPTHLGTLQSGKQCINLCQREINGNQAPNSLSCFGKSRPFSTYHKSNFKENLSLPVNMLHLPSHDLFPLKFFPQHLLLRTLCLHKTSQGSWMMLQEAVVVLFPESPPLNPVIPKLVGTGQSRMKVTP